ncbi:hypothetical protein [Actinoplanes couchii]|uniref:hypothetical protein n=1 Tax=Actinoplanes couchii TaxID=403638 RepID=UPI0019426E64|nr:hypothetical protein [Actinoplanes couchii]MDR6318644.1 hypothetical protein [Actinoplanes couchii]
MPYTSAIVAATKDPGRDEQDGGDSGSPPVTRGQVATPQRRRDVGDAERGEDQPGAERALAESHLQVQRQQVEARGLHARERGADAQQGEHRAASNSVTDPARLTGSGASTTTRTCSTSPHLRHPRIETIHPGSDTTPVSIPASEAVFRHLSTSFRNARRS